MGRNLPIVNFTYTRMIGNDPHQIPYLHLAEGWLGPGNKAYIDQCGEPIWTVSRSFALLDLIPAHQGLRLTH